MSLSTLLDVLVSPVNLPLASLFLTSTTVVNDINEFVVFSSLLDQRPPPSSSSSSSAPSNPNRISLPARFISRFTVSFGGTLVWFHAPTHLLTLASLGSCLGYFGPSSSSSSAAAAAAADFMVTSQNRVCWWAAIALEATHFAMAFKAIGQMKVFQNAVKDDDDDDDDKGRKGKGKAVDDKEIIKALEDLYTVQWWRLWIVNLPAWVCTLVPVLEALKR